MKYKVSLYFFSLIWFHLFHSNESQRNNKYNLLLPIIKAHKSAHTKYSYQNQHSIDPLNLSKYCRYFTKEKKKTEREKRIGRTWTYVQGSSRLLYTRRVIFAAK